jgi:predicted ATPase
MLTQLRLANFRLFGKPTLVKLAPLTILCGANSAGKSSVLKALLLLRQNFDLRESMAYPQGMLQTLGATYDLGTFENLIFNNQQTALLQLGVTVSVPLNIPSPFAPVPSQSPDTLTVDYDVAYTQDDSSTHETARPHASLRHISAHARLKSGMNAMSWKVNAVQPGRDYQLEYSQVDYQLERRRARPPRTAATSATVTFPVMIGGCQALFLIAPPRFPTHEAMQKELYPLNPKIAFASSWVGQAVSGLRYIGPLRAAAKRYNIARPELPSDMDSTGGNLQEVLLRLSGKDISVAFPWERWQIRTLSISEAMGIWLRYLRTGRTDTFTEAEYDIRVVSSVLSQLYLRAGHSQQLFSLPDSGFGYSQVLPIIAQCLLAESGDTVLIEQPELHLNPALQVRLAEFLISVTRTGVQIVAETHSEHIVDMLRVAAAEDPSGILASSIAIQYISVDPELGPSISDLHIQRDGNIPAWPADFMGEAVSISGRLLRAQAAAFKVRVQK